VSSTPTAHAPRRGRIPRLSQFALDHLLLLPLGAAIALVWANLQPESYFRFTYAVSFAVNEVAMVFFFALMTKEVVEATAPAGDLHSWRRVLLPIVAAIGATAAPVLVYMRAVNMLEEPMLVVGWPVVLATDIAVSYLAVRIIFRARSATIPFLLLLAIVSDALGFVLLAAVDPVRNVHGMRAVLAIAGVIVLSFGLRRAGVKSFWPYVIVPGVLSWFGFYWNQLPAALALVPVVPFLPHARRDPGFLVDAPPTARDALSQLELWCRYPAHITLFFFGLVNAGVPIHALEPGTWAVLIAVIVGKPIGTLAGVGVAVAAGLHLPRNVGWRELLVVGLAAATSFSIGLFMTTALLPIGQLRTETSMGVLLTVVAVPLAFIVARLLRVGRFATVPSPR
jgi:NhaA family Na+:H+ antiporter